MKGKSTLVLVPVALALLVAGGSLLRPSPAPRGRVQPLPESPAPGPQAAVPVALPSAGPETDEALKIVQLLSCPRQPAEIFQSRQREARERAERLASRLAEHPAVWKDVLDLLCVLDPEEQAVALAGLLSGGVDARSEPEVLALLQSGSRQGRLVALKLLSPRKNSDTLTALAATAEDPDPRLRLAALIALGGRRADSKEAVDAALARRARLDPDPVLQDTARRLLGEVVPSRAPAPVAARSPFSRSSLVRSTPAK